MSRHTITAFAVLGLVASSAWANSGGITGYSGNPESAGGGAICTSCHAGGTAPTVRFEGPSTVPAGTSATFRFFVHSAAPTKQKAAGFDVSVDEGVLSIISGQGERFAGGEITHVSPKVISTNNEAFWDFTFTAPSSPINVTLYGAGNSVNQNALTTGDNARATTFSFDVVAAAATSTPTATPTPTNTPLPTDSPTLVPTPTASSTATVIAPPSETPTPVDSPTIGPSPTPSDTRVPGSCIGDCDDGGTVTVDELVVGVRIALGTLTPDFCRAADGDHDGHVTVDELVAAVNAALDGCP